MSACPICGLPFGDDHLYAEWYEPCSWWVVYHVRAAKIADFEATARSGEGPLIAHTYCGKADMPKPEGAILLSDLTEPRPSSAAARGGS